MAAMSGAWLRKKVRHPWLGRCPPFDHVLGDARRRDLKPELEQFAVDARRAPKRIFDAHPPDQRAQLRFAAALPMGATSNARGSESRPCANARASRAGPGEIIVSPCF
jgi:hypothetical protein